jgi:prepilin signal peptidase PulO-like enzyme (type II secretory pathway)
VTPTLVVLAAGLGTVVGWAMTVPVHRYKELRPKTPRDLAAEVGGPDAPPVVIRAEYRHARCPSCHHGYRPTDVVPVLSWRRGCPECGRRLPATVLLLQVGVPAAMALTVSVWSNPWVALPFLWLVTVLAAVAVIDLRIWLIPWWMPWVGAAVGLALIGAVSVGVGEPRAFVRALVGGVALFTLFAALWFAAPGKLGFGDVRLAFLLGVFLAWVDPVLPAYGLAFGGVLGIVLGVGMSLARRGRGFPFGPALALGALAAVWLHGPILERLAA